MPIQTLNTIKQWFKTGLKPTQAQFWDTWDSFRHKFDKIPVKEVEGLDELLLSKADKTVLDHHLADKNAHAPQVNTDWNSESGFSQLINKPEFRTINGESIVGTGDIVTDSISLWKAGTVSTSVTTVDGDNEASGGKSIAIGHQTAASGYASYAEGSFTQSSGNNSHAEGNETIASSSASHSEGYQTSAQGPYSHAEGQATKAIGTGSHSEGYQTSAQGLYSHAEGKQTIALGDYSHAGGNESEANAIYSFVHGNNSFANNENTIVLGANITGTESNTTYVDKLNIKTIPVGTLDKSLGVDADGNVIAGSSEGGGSQTFDQVLATGNEAIDKSILLKSANFDGITQLFIGSILMRDGGNNMITSSPNGFNFNQDNGSTALRFQPQDEILNTYTTFRLPTDKPTGQYILATLDDITGGPQTIQQVLETGNTTNKGILFQFSPDADRKGSIDNFSVNFIADRYVDPTTSEFNANGVMVYKNNSAANATTMNLTSDYLRFMGNQENHEVTRFGLRNYLLTGIQTQVKYDTPTVDTNLIFPAKAVAGDYTIATLDDIPSSGSQTFDQVLAIGNEAVDTSIILRELPENGGSVTTLDSYSISALNAQEAGFILTSQDSGTNDVGTYMQHGGLTFATAPADGNATPIYSRLVPNINSTADSKFILPKTTGITQHTLATTSDLTLQNVLNTGRFATFNNNKQGIYAFDSAMADEDFTVFSRSTDNTAMGALHISPTSVTLSHADSSNDFGGNFSVTNGKTAIIQSVASTTSNTSLEFETPLTNTIIKIPAKSEVGKSEYTLATTDETQAKISRVSVNFTIPDGANVTRFITISASSIITLPALADSVGSIYYITGIVTSSNIVTKDSESDILINGTLESELTVVEKSVIIYNDGVNYIVIKK